MTKANSTLPERSIVEFKPSWKFADEVIGRGGNILRREDLKTLYNCIQCGGCTGSCPAGRRTSLRTRLVIRWIQLGLRDNVLSGDDLWACTTCYTCQERCPRQVMITDVIRTARNIAFEEGFAKERHLLVARNFVKTGHSISLTNDIKNVRSKLGLAVTPPTALSSDEALREINRVMELDGFLAKVKEGKR